MKNKILKKLEKWWPLFKITAFLITLAVTLFITNQIVQPLRTPRIAGIEVEPLFIQSADDEYYLVTKITYEIEVPLFPKFGSNKIKLQLPIQYISQSKIELNTNFKESSPYIKVDIYGNESVFNYVNIQDIPITIQTTGFVAKKLESNFYVREKLDSDRFTGAHIGYSDRYWWNDLSLYPVMECAIATSDHGFFGYGKYNERYFSFSLVHFKNNCDLEVRGYKYLLEKDYTVCDENIQFDRLGGKMSFDLAPHEIKNLLFITEDKEPTLHNYTLVFDYIYSDNECLLAWKAYQDFLNKE